MNRITRVAAAAFALVAMLVALGGTASASPRHFSAPVFVQTDNTAGNQVVAYDRAPDGTLTQAGVYDTGGKGGALEGAVVDNLASQGSLAYDREHQLLFAVNAGSNTVSVFRVDGDRLSLRQVIGSGGSFPASIAVRHGLVYVLNAEGEGSVQGYFVLGDRLVPLLGSNRNLGLSATQTPRFTSTPGQVAFSPDGRQLLVTTKGNGSAIDVFGVRPLGRLPRRPVVNSLPGEVPFAVTFDARGRLLVAEAGTNALASFTLNADGTVTKLDAVGTGQAATCWVVGAGGFFYTSNAGSGIAEPLPGGARRRPRPARQHRHARRHRRRDDHPRRSLPLRPDGRGRTRRRVPDRPGRQPQPDRLGHGPRRRRRRGDCLPVVPATPGGRSRGADPGAAAARPRRAGGSTRRPDQLPAVMRFAASDSEVLVDARPHPRARAVQENPLVGAGDLERLADLPGAAAGEVTHRDHRALRLGQRPDLALQGIEGLAAEQLLLGQ